MHRNERFSPEFLQRIECLLQILLPCIINRRKEMPVEAQALNKSVAHFLKKCLTIMDRGYVFRLISAYMELFRLVRVWICVDMYLHV